jgi:hypothetical protein
VVCDRKGTQLRPSQSFVSGSRRLNCWPGGLQVSTDHNFVHSRQSPTSFRGPPRGCPALLSSNRYNADSRSGNTTIQNRKANSRISYQYPFTELHSRHERRDSPQPCSLPRGVKLAVRFRPFMKSRTSVAISSALVSSAKCPASRTWTSAPGTSLR